MFYENLKKICAEKNTYMTTVLKECGAPTGAVSNWKKGAMPNSETLLKISTHLNVSTDYLLKGIDYINLQDDEKYILSIYKKLDDKNKAKLEGYAEERLKEQNEDNKDKEQSFTA